MSSVETKTQKGQQTPAQHQAEKRLGNLTLLLALVTLMLAIVTWVLFL